MKTGTMSVDIITDFDALGDDLIDVSALGLTFRGTNANKNAGDLTYKVYDSINGAEKALGIDIHSTSGSYDGKITVVMANFDGGSVDHAVVLLGAPTLDATDFVL